MMYAFEWLLRQNILITGRKRAVFPPSRAKSHSRSARGGAHGASRGGAGGPPGPLRQPRSGLLPYYFLGGPFLWVRGALSAPSGRVIGRSYRSTRFLYSAAYSSSLRCMVVESKW